MLLLLWGLKPTKMLELVVNAALHMWHAVAPGLSQSRRRSMDWIDQQVLISLKLAAALSLSDFQKGVGHPNLESFCTFSGHVGHVDIAMLAASPKLLRLHRGKIAKLPLSKVKHSLHGPRCRTLATPFTLCRSQQYSVHFPPSNSVIESSDCHRSRSVQQYLEQKKHTEKGTTSLLRSDSIMVCAVQC